MYPEEFADSVRSQAVGGSCQEGRRIVQRHIYFQQA